MLFALTLPKRNDRIKRNRRDSPANDDNVTMFTRDGVSWRHSVNANRDIVLTFALTAL